MKPFRKSHLCKILTDYMNSTAPLDGLLRNYFYTHKALGSHDRKEIAEAAYQIIRWKLLLASKASSDTIESLIEAFIQNQPLIASPSLPAHLRVSFPFDLFQKIEESLGKEEAITFCLQSNMQAPITLRTNVQKISRDLLYDRLAKIVSCSKTKTSPFGITIERRVNAFELSEFKEGFFEIQDEGSQIIADLVEAVPGERVLDFCAGAGGKTLAFAHKLQGRGQIYLSDIRPQALLQAKKRLARAGIQNAQIVLKEHLPKIGKVDWIYVDAPCTGTGTYRRNPDLKWRWTPSFLSEMVSAQRAVFKEALSYLKPHGKIIFATCSVLKEENEENVEFFLHSFPLKIVKQIRTHVEENGPDGFFAAVFAWKN